MRVLIVNTSERVGGAAVAASRLCAALNNGGVKARMLVRDKQTSDITVVTPPRPRLAKWHFLWERLLIYLKVHFKWQHLFDIDTGSSGIDITKLREFREADVIHLHWVNQGMLSLSGLEKVLRSGKAVVWTMHDAWPQTGICHLTMGCRQFTSGCLNCRLLPGGGSKNDLSARVWRRKQRVFAADDSLAFVACSRWLEGEARSSALLRGHHITNIPNPIDTRVYCPGDQKEARRQESLPESGHILLFACQKVTHKGKGMDYLIEACHILAEQHPELAATTTAVILGGYADEVAAKMPIRTVTPGYIGDEQRLVRLYRTADVFVLPSLSENLPNTIMEAMACGVPCLAFATGGVPEEIDHRKNGFVADYKSAASLAEGLVWLFTEAPWQQLSEAAVKKVQHTYSQAAVALRYTELYQQVLAQKHFRL